MGSYISIIFPISLNTFTVIFRKFATANPEIEDSAHIFGAPELLVCVLIAIYSSSVSCALILVGSPYIGIS